MYTANIAEHLLLLTQRHNFLDPSVVPAALAAVAIELGQIVELVVLVAVFEHT